MSPSISDGRRSSAGFTLLEAIVTLVVSAILIATVARFFKDSTNAFGLQKNLMNRDQNAHYVIKRLSEVLMQAGYNLPPEGFSVLKPSDSPARSLVVTVNPRGGKQVVASLIINSSKIPVAEEKEFRAAKYVIWVPVDPKYAAKSIDIDVNDNSGGFSSGLKQVANGIDTLRLKEQVSMRPGDIVYAAAQEDYHLEGGRLMNGVMLLAENIDSLSVSFYDKDEKATLDWQAMQSASIRVSARTPFPDAKLPGDGYRRITLSTVLRFRNKI